MQRLEALPKNCSAMIEGKTVQVVDLGDCQRQTCITSNLQDNGTCEEWWPHHCCGVKDVDIVDVTCAGFSYKISRTVSCQCNECFVKSKITGRAYGLKDGTEIPFDYGYIQIAGKNVGFTESTGVFSFDAPSDAERFSATFYKDSPNSKFLSTVQVFNVKPGIRSTYYVVVPLRPNPIPFNTNIGLDMPLGNKVGAEPIASLSIPADSVVTKDGSPFKGQAHAVIKFTDPRILDDVRGCYGQLSYSDENGEAALLETLGMMQMSFNDEHNNPLFVKAPITSRVNASSYNLTIDEHGNTDWYTWKHGCFK